MSVKLITDRINTDVPVLGTGSGGKVLNDQNSGATIQFGEYGGNDTTITSDDGVYAEQAFFLSSTFMELVFGGTSALNFGDVTAGGSIGFAPSLSRMILQARDIYIGSDSSAKLSFYGTALLAQPAAIGKPGGGATIDAEARAAIDSLIDLLSGAAGGNGLTA